MDEASKTNGNGSDLGNSSPNPGSVAVPSADDVSKKDNVQHTKPVDVVAKPSDNKPQPKSEHSDHSRPSTEKVSVNDSVQRNAPRGDGLVEIKKPRERANKKRDKVTEKVLLTEKQAASIERARAKASENYHQRNEAKLKQLIAEEFKKVDGKTASIKQAIIEELVNPFNKFISDLQHADSEESDSEEEKAPPSRLKKRIKPTPVSKKEQEETNTSGFQKFF